MKSFAFALVLLCLFTLLACPKPGPAPTACPDAGSPPSTVLVANDAPDDTVVTIAFGATSAVTGADFPFCSPSSLPGCQFPLAARASQPLPIGSKNLNATIVFGPASVGCGTTKAELNVNNPAWYDVVDVSLVDGYSNGVLIQIVDPSGAHTLGPPNGRTGNEKVFGLFPLGCDICVARQLPACGMAPGKDGCKAGSQYNPDVPCQYQAAATFGGSTIKVAHVGTPLATP